MPRSHAVGVCAVVCVCVCARAWCHVFAAQRWVPKSKCSHALLARCRRESARARACLTHKIYHRHKRYTTDTHDRDIPQTHMIYLVVSHRLVSVLRKLADHLTDHFAIAESAVVLQCLAPLCVGAFVCVCVCVCARTCLSARLPGSSICSMLLLLRCLQNRFKVACFSMPA